MKLFDKEIIALFLSDIHGGSRWAVWHPDYIFKDGVDKGSKWSLNGIQERLWNNWIDFTTGLRKDSEASSTYSNSGDSPRRKPKPSSRKTSEAGLLIISIGNVAIVRESGKQKTA